jgi:hypothetical protein
LESLSESIPVMLPEIAAFHKLNCMICFFKNGHTSGVSMEVNSLNHKSTFSFSWAGEVSDQLQKSLQDENKASDFAACAIALLLIRETSSYTAVEQSVTGTTIDYYLTEQGRFDDLIFNKSARLEVSGILTASPSNSIRNRINEKKRRLKPENGYMDIIAIVEFGKPQSVIEKV